MERLGSRLEPKSADDLDMFTPLDTPSLVSLNTLLTSTLGSLVLLEAGPVLLC